MGFNHQRIPPQSLLDNLKLNGTQKKHLVCLFGGYPPFCLVLKGNQEANQPFCGYPKKRGRRKKKRAPNSSPVALGASIRRLLPGECVGVTLRQVVVEKGATEKAGVPRALTPLIPTALRDSIIVLLHVCSTWRMRNRCLHSRAIHHRATSGCVCRRCWCCCF